MFGGSAADRIDRSLTDCECYTAVLHRSQPAVRETPDFEGLFRHRKSVAEREGFASPLALDTMLGINDLPEPRMTTAQRRRAFLRGTDRAT
jgi:hypothetical protein